MNISFTPMGWEGYQYWTEHDPKMVAKIGNLVKDIRRSPFSGIGKPEPLRENWKGWWSRRISDEHRLVYRVTESGNDQRVEIAQCRFHY